MGIYIRGVDLPKDDWLDIRVRAEGPSEASTKEHPYWREIEVVQVSEIPTGSDLISRQNVYHILEKAMIDRPLDSDRWVIRDIDKAIRSLPSAEPRTGKWIGSENRDEFMECSNCHHEEEWYSVGGYYQAESFNFCPNCGADMRGEEE